ncbi:MAG: glycoside hydrolase family 25 protein [Myxococcota bacterium]|nr:glycoside hydrolase family 25 protein [Myxococcota bacterium]
MARKKHRLRGAVLALVALVAVAAATTAFVIWQSGRDRGGDVMPCQTGPTVPGIDVSYYQQDVAWKRVRAAGVRFAFVRVSDGLTVRDTRFATNWAGAKRAGILRGAYQYFRPEQSALAQADLMIATLRRDRGELPPVIDVESEGGKAPAPLVAAVQLWVARVRDQLGVEPIVYTGPEFWRDRAGGADLTRQPLWIAHYTRGCPTVPRPWTRWHFWQHTDNGRVPGIEGAVDLDLFAGTYDELEAFARAATRTSASR